MHLCVVFESPGFFLTEPRLTVTLDDVELYEGKLASGFSSGLDVAPGPHVLTTTIDGPMLGRVQQIPLALDELSRKDYRSVPMVIATLHYSRLTGAFRRYLSIAAR
jgi:hypothetical protein